MFSTHDEQILTALLCKHQYVIDALLLSEAALKASVHLLMEITSTREERLFSPLPHSELLVQLWCLIIQIVHWISKYLNNFMSHC